MTELHTAIKTLDFEAIEKYLEFTANIERMIDDAGYTIVEKNYDKPWGAYIRIDSSQADEFVRDFFPGLSPEEARLGIENAELSPKFLIVKPETNGSAGSIMTVAQSDGVISPLVHTVAV